MFISSGIWAWELLRSQGRWPPWPWAEAVVPRSFEAVGPCLSRPQFLETALSASAGLWSHHHKPNGGLLLGVAREFKVQRRKEGVGSRGELSSQSLVTSAPKPRVAAEKSKALRVAQLEPQGGFAVGKGRGRHSTQ